MSENDFGGIYDNGTILTAEMHNASWLVIFPMEPMIMQYVPVLMSDSIVSFSFDASTNMYPVPF